MTQSAIRDQIIAELRAGHLGSAMKLLQDHKIGVDAELREEAISACEGSLRRHFHWIIPMFVGAFHINEEPRLKTLASRIIQSALAHGQPLLAGAVAQTFAIELRGEEKSRVDSPIAATVRSIEQATGAIVIQDEVGEYAFDLDAEDLPPKDMVFVPAGEFIMGTSDEEYKIIPQAFPCDRPQRRVYLDAFYIDPFPVTNEDYGRFVQETDYSPEGTKYGTWRDFASAGKERHPVVSVSWNDILAYCKWSGKRLPTEAEWEKASRGTDGRIWPWGNEWDARKCNSQQNKIGATTPVDRYPQGRSPYGCFDMVGNVWELVSDWLALDYYQWGPTRNPKGPPSGITHVMRGGAFSTRPECCRCAFRIGPDSSTQFDRVGFRCAKSAT